MPQPIILTACPPNGSPAVLHIKRKKQSNTENKKKKERVSERLVNKKWGQEVEGEWKSENMKTER